MLITDARSEKYSDLLQNDSCELCWWLDEAGVQFRISGRAVVASASEVERTDKEQQWPSLPSEECLRTARADVWNRLSVKTKRTFLWTDRPGSTMTKKNIDNVSDDRDDNNRHQQRHPKATASINSNVDKSNDSTNTQAPVPPNFTLLIVIPNSVDELHLGGNQKRFLHTLKVAKQKCGFTDDLEEAVIVATSSVKCTKTGDYNNDDDCYGGTSLTQFLWSSQLGKWTREEFFP